MDKYKAISISRFKIKVDLEIKANLY
jgi:hypothetical protein